MIWAIVGALLAIPLGAFVLRPRVRTWFGGDFQGLKIESFVGPIVTLTVFLAAFVMAQATQSFQRANQDASVEGSAVSLLFENAAMLPDGAGKDLQATSVCYARAVHHIEWPAMTDGETAPEVDHWDAQFNTLVPKVLSGPGSLVGQVVSLNRSQSEARTLRLYEASPHLPVLTVALMIISIIGVLLLLMSFAHHDMKRKVLLGFGIVLALLLGGTLFLVEQLEEPFRGVVKVQPSVIAKVERDTGALFAAQYPGATLPCDTVGRPVA